MSPVPSRPNAANPWTEDDDAALRDMLEDGLHREEAARRLGRSRAAVDDRLRKLGVAPVGTPAERGAARREAARRGAGGKG